MFGLSPLELMVVGVLFGGGALAPSYWQRGRAPRHQILTCSYAPIAAGSFRARRSLVLNVDGR